MVQPPAGVNSARALVEPFWSAFRWGRLVGRASGMAYHVHRSLRGPSGSMNAIEGPVTAGVAASLLATLRSLRHGAEQQKQGAVDHSGHEELD